MILKSMWVTTRNVLKLFYGASIAFKSDLKIAANNQTKKRLDQPIHVKAYGDLVAQ